MNIFHYTNVKAKDAENGSAKLNVRWLISKETGAENFAMRLFEMEAGGNSPLHSHNWEHELFTGGRGDFSWRTRRKEIQNRRRHIHSLKRETSTEKQQQKTCKVSLPHTTQERINR
jgi:hypothetical protein